MNDGFTIGQLAERAGVGVETVRFYERKGLLPEPARDPASGYRRYQPADAARVRFIRRAKELGFSLNDIAGLLSLRVDPDAGCEDVRALAESKIREIESKMADLRRMKRALKEVAERCPEGGAKEECPILNYLEDPS